MGKQRYTELTCCHCGVKFMKRNGDVNSAIRKGQTNFFCGAKCSSRGTVEVRSELLRLYRDCIVCGKRFNGKTITNHCSEECASKTRSDSVAKQQDLRHKNYIHRWKSGDASGVIGDGSVVSAHIRRYLFEKYNGKCSRCGWAEVNQFTKKIPLAVEHVDGDWKNNSEENLTLLCPNCHSLTSTYGSLNRGRGRPYRKKYRDRS